MDYTMSEDNRHEITMRAYVLGSFVIKYNLPMKMIDEINKAYDEASDLEKWNDRLAGKIAEENLVNDLMTDKMKEIFLGCFQAYMKHIQKPYWIPTLNTVWINEMRANEYNPFHYHTSEETDLGLSSVLVLKKPTTYGKEVTKPDDPCNGMLEFVGGQQDTLSIDQLRVNAQPGEFFVFPYTMLHGVYPFNGTEETRRTLSYNCDLLRPPKEEE
tara:strand:- start:1132 stop:1773 length:642 start_codon:yes stop_codon:yes gene_type:complete